MSVFYNTVYSANNYSLQTTAYSPTVITGRLTVSRRLSTVYNYNLLTCGNSCMDQWTVDALSLNAFKNRLSKIRDFTDGLLHGVVSPEGRT